jgi:hypothetical protein
LFVAAALLLLLADIVMLAIHPGVYSIPIGNFRDRYFLTNAHTQEVAEDGTPYRWTRATSTLWLNQVGIGQHTLLTLDLGGRPEPVDVQLAMCDQPWLAMAVATDPRHYTVLLPPNASEQIWIGITTPTFHVSGDPRQLGIKLEGFTIRNLHAGISFPPVGQYFSQLILVLIAQVITARLAWQRRSQAILLVGIVAGLAFLLSRELLLTMEYLPRLATAAAVLALMTWLFLPLVERWTAQFVEPGETRILWAFALGACTVRLLGVLYPSFGGQDLGRNLDRLAATMIGQLYIIAPSGEFAKGLTIYPTGPYLGLMPGALLFADTASLMQGGLAMLDGITAFLAGLIARRLGGTRDAGRLATVLYAGNIAAFSAMSYSFSAQIFGQWFTAPLALLLMTTLAPQSRRNWFLAMILLSFGLFSHIGVAFLAIGWMGLILLFTTLAYRRIPWWGWGLFALTGLTALAFMYIEILRPTLEHAAERVVPRSVGSGTLFKGYRILLINGLRIAYSDVGLVLLPIGIWLMRPAVPGATTWFQQRVVPLAWIGTALFFLMVDLLLDVQVRYFYFALPLVLALIALPLGRIAEWRRMPEVGRVLAWTIVIAIIVPQIALWFGGTWGEAKIPMTPLTH